ncbi:MAG: hypothetical protein AB7N71_13150 [Phycisphaerae bacterium]
MSRGSNLRGVAHSVIIFSLLLVSTNALATGGRPYIANYYVNTTIDDPFLTGEDGGLLSIRGAISRVITDWLPYDPIRTVIHIPAGHYELSYTAGSPENEIEPIYLGYHQYQHLELRGAGRESTILDGGSQSFLLRIQTNSNQSVSITDLTVQNGRNRQVGGVESRGNVFIERCTFRNCVAGTNTLLLRPLNCERSNPTEKR